MVVLIVVLLFFPQMRVDFLSQSFTFVWETFSVSKRESYQRTFPFRTSSDSTSVWSIFCDVKKFFYVATQFTQGHKFNDILALHWVDDLMHADYCWVMSSLILSLPQYVQNSPDALCQHQWWLVYASWWHTALTVHDLLARHNGSERVKCITTGN